jgi:hypothetical protein
MGFFEHCNELSCSIKCGEFLDWLKNCKFSGRTLLDRVDWIVSYVMLAAVCPIFGGDYEEKCFWVV